MRRVTGGGAPAEIWRSFMVADLPRLNAQPIPGGVPLPPSPTDAIDQALAGLETPDAEAPNGMEPAEPEAPAPQPETQPDDGT
jgi:penicillin-binding protein 1A